MVPTTSNTSPKKKWLTPANKGNQTMFVSSNINKMFETEQLHIDVDEKDIPALDKMYSSARNYHPNFVNLGYEDWIRK